MSERAHPPVPVPDERSAGFWAAAAAGTLVLARCVHCGAYAHPPDVVCPACLRADAGIEWVPVSGAGVVRSWTVIRDSFLPGFAAVVPFVLVDVELEVQAELRLVGRLVDGPDAALAVGDRVHVTFDHPAPGVAVPAFALDRS